MLVRVVPELYLFSPLFSFVVGGLVLMALTPRLLLLFVLVFIPVAVRAVFGGSVAVFDFRVAAASVAFCCVLSLFMVLFLLLCCSIFLSHAAIFAPNTEMHSRGDRCAAGAYIKAETTEKTSHHRTVNPGRCAGQ